MTVQRPALIIALGGTGKEVIEKLRPRFHMLCGQPDPPNVRYLFIDTDIKDNEALDRYRQNAFPLTVSTQVMQDIQRPGSSTTERLQLDDWFEPNLLQNITTQSFEGGVRGVRMLGRLALLASSNLGALRSRLVQDILSLRKSVAGNDPGAMLVFVVASGGGGTGSGIFLDIGYLLTSAIRETNISRGLCETEGIAAIAATGRIDWPAQMRNSVALVQELDHYSLPANIFQARYGDHNLPNDIGRQAPYDFISLVAPTQKDEPLADDSKSAIRELEGKIADYIFMRLTAVGGTDAFGARLHDIQENFSSLPIDNKGYPNRYTTFGVSVRQFPIGICLKMATRRALREFIEIWLKPAQPGEDILAQSVLEQDSVFSARYYQDLKSLRDLLGMREPHEVKAKKPRPSNTDPLFAELTLTTHEPLPIALKHAVERGDIDAPFQYTGASQSLNSAHPGYIAGTVARNRERLLSEKDPESLYNRVLAVLYEITFDVARGPRYMLRLLNELCTELRLEILAIDEALSVTVSGRTTVKTEETRVTKSPADPPKDLWLLGWNYLLKSKTPTKTIESSLTTISVRANAKFERELLLVRKQIYIAFRTLLKEDDDSLDRQTRTVIHFTEDWLESMQAEENRDQLVLNTLLKGTIYNPQLVEELLQNLKENFSPRGLEALRKRMFEGAFRHDILRTPEGTADYSIFDPLTNRVRAHIETVSIRQRYVIKELSVLRMIADHYHNDLAKECVEMAREGRPLLNLDLGTVGYGELIDNQRFGKPTTVWRSIAQRGLEVDLYQRYQEGIKFACAQVNANSGADAGIQETEHQESSVVATLFVRGAFPSHIISGYEHDRRRTVLFPPNAENLTTPFTNRNIALIVDPDRIQRATTAILIGEALRPDPELGWRGIDIQWDIHDHTYTFRIPGRQRDILVYPKDLEMAALRLANNQRAFTQLINEIRQIAQEPSNVGYIREILLERHIKTLREKVNQRQEAGYYEGLDLQNLHFQKVIDCYYQWMNENYISLNDEDLRGRHAWAYYDPKENRWRCNHCKFSLKAEAPSEEETCPNCKRGA